ncbi:hypothetical protein D046_5931, partial [Vibrio parahaemolyticus V-223/04]
MQEQIRESQQT